MSEKKVLVSGCFDLLHAGHVTFLKTAATYGSVYVSVGSDDNLKFLKGKKPNFSQEERVYMLNALQYVKEAFVSTELGKLDFEEGFKRIRPDIFIVNTDGDMPEKKELCRKYGVEYVVLERLPEPGLPERSSSEMKMRLRFPYRLCIAGGWIDQPWASKIHPGSVVVAQVWPTIDFFDRAGMATSSRNVALELWGGNIPEGDPIRNAQMLFGAENLPDKKYVSGSQDHIGLLCPGVNRLYYDGGYWPSKIESTVDPETCGWLSRVLQLVPLKPRSPEYDPLRKKNLKPELVKSLGESGENAWKGILKHDVKMLGKAISQSFRIWREMLPLTVPNWTWEAIRKYEKYPGASATGGEGGYVMVASEEPVDGAFTVRIRY